MAVAMLIYALFGLVVGAVLNILADNLPHRREFAPPRCRYCGNDLPPLRWMAVPAYLAGRGQCPDCAGPLPLRNVLVELGTMLSFVFLWLHYGPGQHLLFASIYMAVFLLLTVIDLEKRMIPNLVVLPAVILALIAAPFTPGLGFRSAIFGGALAFVLFSLIAMVYPGGIYGGDVKLMALIGLICGFPSVIVAIIAGLFTGGIVAVALLLAGRVRLKSYFPYGPSLIVGGVIGLLYGAHIVEWYLGHYL